MFKCDFPPFLGIIIRTGTKTMVTPQSFSKMAEDKENVNPETGSSLLVTSKKNIIQVEQQQKTEQPEKLVTEELSDCSSDGFDVNESLELDEASLSEDDSQGIFSLTIFFLSDCPANS